MNHAMKTEVKQLSYLRPSVCELGRSSLRLQMSLPSPSSSSPRREVKGSS
jgi:hypothetical protein